MSALTRLLLGASLRRAGRGGAGGPALRRALPTADAANLATHAGWAPPPAAPGTSPFSAASSAVAWVRGAGLACGPPALARSFTSAAAEAAPKPKRRAAPKKSQPAGAAAARPRSPATPRSAPPPPPPPPVFPILSTADGRDPFTAFTEAAGDAFASAFGPGGGGAGGASAPWEDDDPAQPPPASPLAAGLAALASPWLTPVQRQELVDNVGAAWAAWGFPDPAGPDPSGGSAGFGPDGRAPDPKAAAARAAVLDAALVHVVRWV